MFTNDGRNEYYENDLGTNGQLEKVKDESRNRNEVMQRYPGLSHSPTSNRNGGYDSQLGKNTYEMENTPRGAAVSNVYNQLGWNESEMSDFINGEASKATHDLLNDDFNFLTPGSVNRLQDPYEMNESVSSIPNLTPSPSFSKKESPRQDFLKSNTYSPNYEMPEAAFGAYCPECQKLEPTASKLKEHLTLTHYAKEIRERYMSPTSSVCEIEGCMKDFAKNRGSLVRHIGSTHHKALEIMEERGIKIPSIFSDRKRSREDFNFGDTKKTPEKKIKQEIKKETETPLKKRFSCPECSASYMQPKPLQNHMMKVHFH